MSAREFARWMATVRPATRISFRSAVNSLGGYSQGLYAEKWAPFVKELAVMVARSRSGQVASYPIVETVHQDNICLVTEAPAQAPSDALDQARRVAERAIASLEGAGVFGVEMFLLADGSVLLNEVAPRPHNSGHYTIEACATSQFEQHIRTTLGWPLGDTSLLCGSSVMLNVLGEASGEQGSRLAHEMLGRALATPGAKFHWYGKEGVTEKRKIGHVTSESLPRLAELYGPVSHISAPFVPVSCQSAPLTAPRADPAWLRSVPVPPSSWRPPGPPVSPWLASSWDPTLTYPPWGQLLGCSRSSGCPARSPLSARTAPPSAWSSMLARLTSGA